jgi:hypothetical protein
MGKISGKSSEASGRKSALGIRNREERERYMDSLEQQMEHQRERIERTLDETKGSSRLRAALGKLRGNLPSVPLRTSGRHAGERRTAAEQLDGESPRRWWKVWQ